MNILQSAANPDVETMQQLDHRASAAYKRHVQAEWELAQLLTTMDQRGQWQELGFSSIVDYAERRLGMPADHLFSLLRLFSDVSRFALANEAWRKGEIGRGKLRELLRVMTPATEKQWLDFARQHTCREVERQVVLRPRQATAARQNTASQAASGQAASGSAASGGPDEKPLCEQRELPTTGEVAVDSPPLEPSIDEGTVNPPASELPTIGGATVDNLPLEPGIDEATANPPAPQLPAPKMVRMELTFEPAQYAVIEAALDLVRAQGGGRNRESLFVEMAQRILAKAEARTRRRHAVVVEKDASTGEVAYVTDRGYLPAQQPNSKAGKKTVDPPKTSAKADKQTVQRVADTITVEPVKQAAQPVAQIPAVETTKQAAQPVAEKHAGAAKTANGRTPLPASVERAVLERAGYACERCGRRQGLQIHHIDRVCHGGTHDPARLALLCKVCHASEHREEFDSDVTFALGRDLALANRSG
jgi:hypothetical protein